MQRPKLHHYRFGVLLGLILVTLAYSLAAPTGEFAHIIAVALQAAVLVAAVISTRMHRVVIALAIAAAVIGIAGSAAALVGTDEFDQGSASVVALPYVVLTPIAITSGLVKHFRVEGGATVQMMFGVLCLYLLIGLAFGTVFAFVDEVGREPFFTSDEAGSDFLDDDASRDDFLYFSFSTLTTTGYGDLTAATNVGRSLSITEALIGQIYLVTVVALIVSNLRPAKRRSA
ncbi:MAG: potassium channel family protein [Solirubrobacterales bacterium]